MTTRGNGTNHAKSHAKSPNARTRRGPAAPAGRRRAPLEALERRTLLSGSVVINEIHYNPDVKTQLVEYVELHNPGDAPVDLGGASFSKGVGYTFPAGTTLPAGGYLVVAENPAAFQSKFARTALGPWTGGLANEGEEIEVRDAAGNKLDEVDYGAGFPWPTVGDAPGYSIELINPALDNDLGGSWRSKNTAATTDTTLVATGQQWRYRKGTQAQAPFGSGWRGTSFNDSGWSLGTLPIGYDSELTLPTNLTDMNGTTTSNYSTVYLRKTFALTDAQRTSFSSLRLEAMYDDGFNVWVNGQLAQRVNSPSDNPSRTSLASTERESSAFQTFTLNPAHLVTGTNVIAVHFMNVSQSGSPDAFFDGRLVASGTAAGPTPGRANAAFAANAAPAMRQVDVSPRTPAAGQPVTITTKVTDPNGVSAVTLSYSTVDAGNYVNTTDPAYSNPANWTNVTMRDDGAGGDATAGDGTYTAQLPGSVQVNRRLVRYRITATDGLGLGVTAPYADDPVQNFAYYVYNGVPSWTGADRPGVTAPVTYSSSTLTSVPVIQLLTKKAEHVDAQHIPPSTTSGYTGDNYLWSGTLVYNGVVYDNIHYRARGGVWRYAMGKNMWKFDFNNGHDFQATDVNGNPYGVKWKKLNLGANIQQGDIGMRGEQGMFETLGFQLFDRAGVPAPSTTPIHFRIVENANETDPASQFNGDFQGMYLALEQPDGRYLEQHGLPDGNLYKMESGSGPGGGTSNNQGPTQPADNSDLVAFTGGLNSSATDQWIRDNVDLEMFYSFQAVVEMAHHLDIGFGKNYFYYHNPVTNKWAVLPWDMDLTWYVNYGSNGSSGGKTPFANVILARPTFQAEYRGRVRELRDLLFNSGEIGKLADAYAALVNPGGGATPTLAQADRAMWDYNPILASGHVNSSKAGQGRFYANSQTTRDFAGMVARLKSFSLGQFSYIDSSVLTAADEAAAPAKPSIAYTGPGNFPADALTFSTGNFAPGNTGSPFAAMEWRLADVTVTGGTNPDLEINAAWESPVLTTFSSAVTVPGTEVVPGHTYRVRVRTKDQAGRWGHWSDPVQFLATAPGTPIASALRVSEIHYNPPGAGSTLGEEFEFIELTNTGSTTLDLKGMRFVTGIEFTFPASTSYFLAPGARALLVRNQAAFESRYGTGLPVAGVFANRLADGGEQLVLAGPAGQTILDFAYSDGWYPHTDGGGFSLVLADPPAAPTALSDKQSWRASYRAGGNPGVTDPGLNPGTVVINEALTHTDQGTGDWVELRNTTGQPVDVSGWFLSDSSADLRKYQIQPGTVVPAGGYLVLTQASHFGVAGNPGALSPFGFSEHGETVYLTGHDGLGGAGGYRETESFGAAAEEVTFGRHVKSTGGTDFTAMTASTPGGANNGGPRVGPVVINEVMYNPANAASAEFVELRNVTGQAVPLYDPANPQNAWKLNAGVDFTFPGGASIPALGYALVVPVDPANFRAQYSVPANVAVYGPYTGVLDNAGERVTIARPGTPELDGFVPYVDVDSVNYADAAPWPVAPDATGPSLSRVTGAAYANDPGNWASALTAGGTPGSVNFPGVPQILSATVNDGAAQRSMVKSLTLTFDTPVWLGTDAFALSARDSGALIPIGWSNPAGDGRTWLLSLTGAGLVGGSLPDGVYDLAVTGPSVHGGSPTGPVMAGDFDMAFHRLYSDADGDGDSDNADLFQVRNSYNKPTNDPGFRWYFDYENDNDVDNADLFQVRNRRSVTFKGY